MRNILKKLIPSIASIAVLSLMVLQNNSFAQEFLSDLKHLNRGTTFPGIVYETVEVPRAWDEIRTSLSDGRIDDFSPVKVGIIDTGIDAGHPEFSSLVDFGNTPPFAKFDSEREGHGTQVTGIIGANNLIGSGETLEPDSSQMNGILSGVSILPYALEVRKGGAFEISGKTLNAFSVANRVDDFIEEGVDIINMSLGGVPILSPFFSGIVHYFEKTFTSEDSKDILFVVGAGNDDKNANLVSPANLGDNLENVITVGGTTGLNRWPNSNFGDAVNISAPADFIYAPVPRGQGDLPESGPEQNNYSDKFGGTSGATPFVTGVAGLLKAINSDLTPAEIKQILIETGDEINTDKPIGPRLNAHSAVCHQKALNCPETGESPWSQFQHDV